VSRICTGSDCSAVRIADACARVDLGGLERRPGQRVVGQLAGQPVEPGRLRAGEALLLDQPSFRRPAAQLPGRLHCPGLIESADQQRLGGADHRQQRLGVTEQHLWGGDQPVVRARLVCRRRQIGDGVGDDSGHRGSTFRIAVALEPTRIRKPTRSAKTPALRTDVRQTTHLGRQNQVLVRTDGRVGGRTSLFMIELLTV
jgi:hypothetical protein